MESGLQLEHPQMWEEQPSPSSSGRKGAMEPTISGMDMAGERCGIYELVRGI